MEASKDTIYYFRVTYDTELYLIKADYQQLGNLGIRLESRWPELECIEYSIVCHDEKGRTCYVDDKDLESTVDLLFDTFAKQYKWPSSSPYSVLDLTVLPKSTKFACARDASSKRAVDHSEPQCSKKAATWYRYQVRYGDECFISPHHSQLDFSWETIREDIASVWPCLSEGNISVQCRDENARTVFGRQELVVKHSSIQGLYDCFAHEVVRSNGESVLILKLTVVSGDTFDEALSVSSSDDVHAPKRTVPGVANSSGSPGTSWVMPSNARDDDSDTTIYGQEIWDT